MTNKPFSGNSGGSSSPHSEDDNIFTTDVVELVLGISEGPINRLVDGAKGFYAGDTPLRSQTGDQNVGTFELTFLRGKEEGQDIKSKLGGFASSTSVGVSLSPSVDIVRQGTHTNIDYLDIRVAVNRLAKEDKKGSWNNEGKFQIQYRKVGASTWKDVKTVLSSPPPDETDDGANMQKSQGYVKKSKVSISPGDRVAYWQTTPVPILTDKNAIWFKVDDNNRPRRVNSAGTAWENIPGATFSSGVWTWNGPSAWGNDNTFKAYVNARKPKNANQGDFWLRVPDAENAETLSLTYLYNGNTFVIAGGSLSPGGFNNGENTTIEEDGIVVVKGRVSSTIIKEFRIPVDNYNGLWEMKVTRITPADDGEHFFDITWESFQEVTSKNLNFPALATSQLVIGSSDQFSSIPDFWGLYEGRIVRVPSNYDPEDRTYSGIWDLTWKQAYTNNPAFVGNDLVFNDRYGMNAYYPITMTDMDVYAAGQWCDYICADGKPRFTFNGLISSPLGGREAINYIFGIFGGRFFDDGNGKGAIKIDDQATASMVFSAENVEDGLFIYSFTDIMSRANDITVTFDNPELDWNQDRRRVYDQDHIDKYGRIPLNFEAVGCTDEQEAVRRGRYRLITATTEVMTVSFKTNRKGLYLSPYDVVLVSDDDMDNGLSGRVQSLTGLNQINLRDPIYLEPGFNYTLVYDYFTGTRFEVRTIDINNGISGSRMSIPLQDNLPSDTPEQMVFSIQRRDGTEAPKAFRIISLGEVDNEPDKIEVQAVEINRNKWLYIDGYIHTPELVDYINTHPNRLPDPVPEVRCKAKAIKTGRSFIYDVELDWDPSPSSTAIIYDIYYSRNNSQMVKAGETRQKRMEFHHIKQGEYVFQVIARNHKHLQSDPTNIEHRLRGDLSQYDTVENLVLVDEVSALTYQTRAPLFEWDPVESGAHDKYVVQIRNPDTNALIKTRRTQRTRWRYAYDDNKTDHSGTPARRFKVRLYSQDQNEQWGDPTDIVVNNPAPPVPSNIAVEDTVSGAFVTYDKPTKRDWVGVIIYASTTTGFTPGSGNVKYQGPDTSVRLKLNKHQVWYVRVASYDVFGDTGLNVSGEYVVNTDAELDEDDIEDGAVTRTGTMSVKNQPWVSLSGNKNWTGNTVKTRYTESVVLDTFTAFNPFTNPIKIDGNIQISNRLVGAGAASSGQNLVSSTVVLEYQAPGTATWLPLNRLRIDSRGSTDAIKGERIVGSFGMDHPVKASGNHKYRLRLIVVHKRAYTAGLTGCDVLVRGNLTFLWLKK